MASIQTLTRKDGSRSYKVIWRDPTGKQRTKTFGGNEARARARTFRSKTETSLTEGGYRDPKLGRQAFGEFLRESLEARPMSRQAHDRKLKPKTLAWYEHLADRWVYRAEFETAEQLRNRPIGRVDRALIEAYIGEVEAHVGTPTVHAVFTMLRRTLSIAIERGLAPAPNACSLVRVARAERREMQVLTADQLETVVDRAPDHHRALILVLGYCGLRWGEATALERRHVDVLRGRISVEQSLTEVRGKGLILSPTTKGGKPRQVLVPRRVADELARHLATYGAGEDPTERIFTTLSGAPLRNSNFRGQVWEGACRDAGLTPRPRIHDLRHTAASLAIAAGYHAKQVQEMLGHASIAITMDVYGHLFDTLQEESVGRLDDIARAARAAPVADVVSISG